MKELNILFIFAIFGEIVGIFFADELFHSFIVENVLIGAIFIAIPFALIFSFIFIAIGNFVINILKSISH